MTEETILNTFASIDSEENHQRYAGYSSWIKQIASEINDQLSVEDQKQAKSSFYYMVYNSTL
jgi:hypothetical protein